MANIPMDFIDRGMNTWVGDSAIKVLYDNIVNNIVNEFTNGKSYKVLGLHGVGKTYFACNVIKYAALKGYGSLYCTFNDILSVTLYAPGKSKHECRKELLLTDFLCIDEFDQRFMSSDSSGEMFGRILEGILRIRFHNKLPTIITSNDVDPAIALGDKLRASISSLLDGYTQTVYVFGSDKRKEGLCSSK